MFACLCASLFMFVRVCACVCPFSCDDISFCPHAMCFCVSQEAERTREIQRRKDGQKMVAVKEQLESDQRKRDAEAAKRASAHTHAHTAGRRWWFDVGLCGFVTVDWINRLHSATSWLVCV